MPIFVYIQHTKYMVQTEGFLFCMPWCHFLISERRKEERVYVFAGHHIAKQALLLSIDQPERNELKLGKLTV